jgi:hypothetical protein
MAIANCDPDAERCAAEQLRKQSGGDHEKGPCSGLLFGDADRFLIDLAMNLELRASLIDMKSAIDAARNVKSAVRKTMNFLRPYQERVGFVDAYGGPLHVEFNQQLERLGVAEIDKVLTLFSDWRDPGVRNGIVARLLDAVGAWCG